MPGYAVDASVFGDALRGDLIAHRLHGRHRRTDERDARPGERLGKRGVLGQEAVAGMHRVGAGRSACLHDPVDDQIALGRRRRADAHGLVGHLHVQAVRVRLRIDGNGRNTHPARRPHDATRNLTSVRDEDFLEHARAAGSRACARGSRASCSRASRASGRYADGWCAAG